MKAKERNEMGKRDLVISCSCNFIFIFLYIRFIFCFLFFFFVCLLSFSVSFFFFFLEYSTRYAQPLDRQRNRERDICISKSLFHHKGRAAMLSSAIELFQCTITHLVGILMSSPLKEGEPP